MTREEAINLLTDEPYKVGHLLGFDKLTELHNDWLKMMLFSEKDITLQAHREAYKTTCVSLLLPTLAVLQPSLRILFLRKSEDDVKEIIHQSQNNLKDEKFRYIVESIYGCDVELTTESATEINTSLNDDVKGASQIKAFGIGGSMTGKHYDLIITDDIVNMDDRYSKPEREKTKRVVQELTNLLNRGGRFINLGTPWHPDDAFQLMAEPMKYDCYSTGLMTEEQIAKKKEKMSPSLFCANYELKHIASEEVIFSNPQTGYDASLCIGGIVHIDSAFHGSDYSAFTIITKKGENFFVYGRCWRKHIEECYDEIKAEYERFLAFKLYTEDNADKGLVARDLKNKGLKTRTYHESMNKYVKIVTYLKNVWKNVHFVEGTDEEYIQQPLLPHSVKESQLFCPAHIL